MIRSLLAALLLLTPALHADATRQDWLGDYVINHDGHPGMLRIALSRRRCVTDQCAGLEAQYLDQNGAAHPTAVRALDQNGQHLSLTVSFPGNPQPFDLYIFSFDKNRLAGTTVWQGLTFGVTAARAGTPESPASSARPGTAMGTAMGTATSGSTQGPAGSKQTVGPDGTVSKRMPDGTVKTRKLGGCGWDITTPQGKVIRPTCTYAAVIQLVPPDPPAGSAQDRWLRGQDDTLLSILQSLLDPASYQNYLSNYESTPGTAIYKQVYFRTKAIADFTAPQ